jgi:hypothetical protein
MPIKHEFLMKTIVRGSDNITTPASIEKELNVLRANAVSDTGTQDGRFEVLVTKKNGVMTDDLSTEGKLTDAQNIAAKTILGEAIAVVKAASDDGKLRIKFVLKK